MRVSLGIITCRDRENIPELLRSISGQRLSRARIAETIIVAPEEDQPAIRVAARGRRGIRLIDEGRRRGKFAAVNLFLKQARHDILVLCSGDVILHEDAIERLCTPFSDRGIGIVASRPKPFPIDEPSLLGDTVSLLWGLRHALSSQKPKYGELLAFRNLHLTLPKTAVDEEMIASLVLSSGYRGAYAEDAIVYSRGPKSARDFIRQRRRIYCGHLSLKREQGYTVPTLSTLGAAEKGALLGVRHPKLLTALAYGALLEGASRVLGTLDFLRGKDHSVWHIIDK